MKITIQREENLTGKNYMANQKNGEYVFVLNDDFAYPPTVHITIAFTVNDKGEIIYQEPSFDGYSIT